MHRHHPIDLPKSLFRLLRYTTNRQLTVHDTAVTTVLSVILMVALGREVAAQTLIFEVEELASFQFLGLVTFYSPIARISSIGILPVLENN